MKSKKRILIVLLAAFLVFLIAAVCVGLYVAPTVNHALRIAALLEPMIEAENQSMHVAASVDINADTVGWDSDIYRITEDGTDFLALEQKGIAIYVSDNILLLENGKAFKLGEKMQKQTVSYQDLLPRIGALYDVLKITAEETEDGAIYEITVTGEQVDTLLAAASIREAVPVEGIKTLYLSLTEKNGKLEQITFSGDGMINGSSVSLNVILSDFRILASGDYPIPAAVKQSAATVDPDSLFSLSEDLYRLVLALVPLADMESLNGTLALRVDCGPLQLDTEMRLSDLQTNENRQIDWEKVKTLPETVLFMCMEGDLRCVQNDGTFVYTLELDGEGMQNLSRLILPDLAQYGSNLTEGSVTVTLEGNAVSSVNISIHGKINALILQFPIAVCAEFFFD